MGDLGSAMCDMCGRNDSAAIEKVDMGALKRSSDPQALLKAAAKNEEHTVIALLSGKAEVNQSDKKGNTALHKAAQNAGSSGLVGALLSAKADPAPVNDEGLHPLYLAVTRGEASTVALLVDAGCDLNLKNGSSKSTALHQAAVAGNVAIAQILMKTIDRYNIDEQDQLQNTALHHAVASSSLEICRNLLRHGANPDAKNKWGDTPNSAAVKQHNTKVIALFEDPSLASGDRGGGCCR